MNSISDRELLENRDRVEQLRFTASVVGELIARNQIELVLGQRCCVENDSGTGGGALLPGPAGKSGMFWTTAVSRTRNVLRKSKNHLCVGGAGGRLRQAARLLSAALDGGGVPWYHFPVPGKKL